MGSGAKRRTDEERKKGKTILIAGAAILDVLAVPVEKEVFEKGSVPADTIRLSMGGDALNEATVLARLGKKPELLTVLGKDRAGEMIRGYCEKEGIGLTYTREIPHMDTGINLVLVRQNAQRCFITNPKGSLRMLGAEHFPEEFPWQGGIFCLASMFVSPGLGIAQMADIFRKAKERGMTVCADMTKCKNGEDVKQAKEALARLDYVFANEEEAALLTGETQPDRMAQALREAGCGCAVIKCGAKGCYLCGKQAEMWIPAFKTEKCVDTTGAGDSFCAGFLYGLSEGMEDVECARFANACGCLAVQAVGTEKGILNLNQVLELKEKYCGI